MSRSGTTQHDRSEAGLDPEQLRRAVKRLAFRTRRNVEDLLAGNYQSAYKGVGIEFAEVREYEPGDDVRSIDWNVTARTGKPHIKRFVEERQLTVMIAVDMSASESFGTRGRTKREVSIEVASMLAATAARHHDRVGLVLFTEKPEVFLPPKKGRLHMLRVMREMVGFSPMFAGTELTPAIDLIGAVLRRRSLVFVVSDFILPGETFGESSAATRSLAQLNQRHEVVAMRVTDPRELDLPPMGLVRFRDAETGRHRLVDLGFLAKRRYRKERAQQFHAVERAMARSGVDLVELSTDRPVMPELLRHFRSRQGAQR